jgi:hypothetical protein
MQANPEVMRYLVTGRIATRAEIWRTMGTFLGGDRCAAKAYGPARQSRAAISSARRASASRSTGRSRKKKIRLLSA